MGKGLGFWVLKIDFVRGGQNVTCSKPGGGVSSFAVLLFNVRTQWS